MKELQNKLAEITEPRRVSYGNIRHKLDDIIIIGLCTVICGGEDYNDMEAFGREREEEHTTGDCFTRDCVKEKKLNFCGECKCFPCDTIMTNPHSTVLDKDWFAWKKKSKRNR